MALSKMPHVKRWKNKKITMRVLFHYADCNANVNRQMENTWGGVGYYRAYKVSQQLKGHEVLLWGNELTKKDESIEERWERVFEQCDVFWTSYFNHAEEASALFYTRDKLNRAGSNKRVVIDVDDNFLELDDNHPLKDRVKAGKRDKVFMSTIVSFADVVTVSTEPLKQRLAKHFKDVYKLEKEIIVIPNMNDTKDWPKELNSKHKDKIVIGYTGSNSHNDDMAMFLPELHKIMKKYPNVYFESIGAIGKNAMYLFEDWGVKETERCDLLPSTWTFNEYPKMLSETKWDIGVAPVIDSAFTRCKSHIKFLEYSSIKIPTIASRVYPYYVPISDKEVIEHEKTGVLVKPSEWFNALEDLILHPEKRKKLAENAHAHVLLNWQYDDGFMTRKLDEVLKTLYP